MSRYSRQQLVPVIGVEGQEKLRDAKVLVIGAGGLGAPVLLYLAAAGVGTIGVADGDRIEVSNLQRQVLYRTCDAGRKKVDVAIEVLKALNPDVDLRCYPQYVTPRDAGVLVHDYDIVVSASDSFAAKLMINDACVCEAVPCVHGGVSGIDGQIMTTLPGTACYRCAFNFTSRDASAVENFAQTGTLGPAAGVAGTLQAAEVMKYVCGYGTLLTDRILLFDLSESGFHTLPVMKREDCSCCR